MIDQNNAAQAVEKAIRAAITLLDGDLDHANAETMRALLSKLRATVADDRTAFEAWAGVAYRNAKEYTNRDHRMGLAAWEAARAALASAPVAGEARSLAEVWKRNAAELRGHGHNSEAWVLESCAKDLEALDVAPRASEAVRNAALEEAASMCESWMMARPRVSAEDVANQTMGRMARYIRAIKSQSASLSAQPAAEIGTPRSE